MLNGYLKNTTKGSNHRAIVCVLLCVLLCFTGSVGCIEHFIEGDPPQCYDQDSNRVSSIYLSERLSVWANGPTNEEYIVFNNDNFIFNDGNFTDVNYQGISQSVQPGRFKRNGDILTLNYNNVKSIDYTVTSDGHELIPLNENASLPEPEIRDDRFMRKLYCQ